MPLDRLVERCFGPEARLEPGHRPGSIHYLVVSGASGPRWLVPARPNAAGLAAARGWRPHDLGARLKWSAFIGAWRTGTAAHLPGVQECLVVIAGQVRCGPAAGPVDLAAGDSVHHDAALPHVYQGLQAENRALLLMIYT